MMGSRSPGSPGQIRPWASISSLGGTAETVPARAVRKNGSLIQSSSKAPVLILGDANATAGKSTGTSFADQLAFDLRVPVDIQSSATDGRNVPRTRVLRKSVMSPGYCQPQEVRRLDFRRC